MKITDRQRVFTNVPPLAHERQLLESVGFYEENYVFGTYVSEDRQTRREVYLSVSPGDRMEILGALDGQLLKLLK